MTHFDLSHFGAALGSSSTVQATSSEPSAQSPALPSQNRVCFQIKKLNQHTFSGNYELLITWSIHAPSPHCSCPSGHTGSSVLKLGLATRGRVRRSQLSTWNGMEYSKKTSLRCQTRDPQEKKTSKVFFLRADTPLNYVYFFRPILAAKHCQELFIVHALFCLTCAITHTSSPLLNACLLSSKKGFPALKLSFSFAVFIIFFTLPDTSSSDPSTLFPEIESRNKILAMMFRKKGGERLCLADYPLPSFPFPFLFFPFASGRCKSDIL